MSTPGIHFEPSGHGAPPAIVRKHSLDRNLDWSTWMTSQHVTKGHAPQSSGIASMMTIHLVFSFLARNADFGRVDHHHEVSDVSVGRVHSLLLALQQLGHIRGDPAQGLARSIDNNPSAFHFRSFCAICHDISSDGGKSGYLMFIRHRPRAGAVGPIVPA